MQKSDPGARALLLSFMLMLAMTGLLMRLAHMQLLQHENFALQATAQRYHTVPVSAPRGEILDRNGKVLATTRPAYRVHLLYPGYVTYQGRVALPNPLLRPLAKVLSIDPTDLEDRARQQIALGRFWEPFLVKEDLSPEETARLTELRHTYPMIFVDSHPVRHYPQGDLAAHLLGHLGPVDEQELDHLTKLGYQPWDQIGKTGLELQYERTLRGTAGHFDMEVDAFFRPTYRRGTEQDGATGQLIRTTIDIDLQRTVEQSLARTLDWVRTNPDWEGVYFPDTDAGAVIVMDVKTGEVLAMASHPTFDPNLYAAMRTPQSLREILRLSIDPLAPLYNRAVEGEYLPGSTWKMLTAASALDNGVIAPTDQVVCHGVFDKVEPKLDWKVDGHGPVDLISALANSCNIYFYEVGYRLGIERLAETAARFGFGRRLGIDLPEEGDGWIPDEAARLADTDPSSWSGGRLLSAAIGQGPTATPLQLARFAATLANGGVKVRPHLVTSIGDGRSLRPSPDGQVDLDAEHFRYIVDGMTAVTEWGTSSTAFEGLPLKVAGKTGTAEVVGAGNCAGQPLCAFGIYLAFAPADAPQVAVAVVGERAGHGDSMNPVARAALAHYFKVDLPANDPLFRMGILDPDRSTKIKEGE